jgi:serine/threonine-protein kinase HipA
MEREIHVYLDVANEPLRVGRLWARDKQGMETATFMYDASWLKRPGAVSLAPSLPLTAGTFQSSTGLFAPFSDAAPDRWGKKLMRHHERDRAASMGTKPRKLLDADFLLAVNDEIRLGALRFKLPKDERFLSFSAKPVPPLIELKTLLSAADRVEKGKERKGDLSLLLAPGGSLGGARPKAVIRDRHGHLTLAKFPWKMDEWSVILWEKVTLDLAKNAGVDVSGFRLEPAGKRQALLINRFDRRQNGFRVPYMSVMTALGAVDHEEDRSYLEIVDALRQLGGEPESDARQLWRRMVFNILVSNTDDHPRNHGLLLGSRGWRLAPAFDMNPCPHDVGGGLHVLAINAEDHTGSLDIALSVANYFGLSSKDASAIAGEVGLALASWREKALAHKIPKHEIERLSSAFVHSDLDRALAGRVTSVPRLPARAKRQKSPARI